MSDTVRLLVAEDREDDRILLRQAIHSSGLQIIVDFVRDGQEVINYLTSRLSDGDNLPTLALLDLNLPRFSGLEVAKWIKEKLGQAGLNIIIWSGSMDPRDRDACYENGATLFMTKPSEYASLESVAQSLYCVARGELMQDGYGI
jgi:two-component system, response regulator